MRIELDVLRLALERLLSYAEATKGRTVDVSEDLYWFIPKESLQNPDSVPTDLNLGSLDDDWAEVSAIAKGQKEPLGYAFVWASSIIRALGDRTM